MAPDSCFSSSEPKSGTTKATPKRALDLHNRVLKIPEIANALYISERNVLRYLSQFSEVA
jgi:hypothetical protein